MKFLPCLLVLLSFSFTFLRCSGQCLGTKELKPLYVFGDSLFDGGNNPYLNDESYNPSHYPYGLAYFIRATGRMSDGRLVPDFISQFANLGLLPPSRMPGANFTNGANFASAGAGILDDEGGSLKKLNLPQQMGDFKKLVANLKATMGETAARQKLGKAVYLFSFGGLDMMSFFTQYYNSGTRPSAAAQRKYIEEVLGNFSVALNQIYSEGGRKFAFQNASPMGCLPMSKSRFSHDGQCVELLLHLTADYNRMLSMLLHALAQSVHGFKYSVFDYYNALLDRIKNPTHHGFINGTAGCCGDKDDAYRGLNCGGSNYALCDFPSAYVFFDGGHTTQHTNLQLARLMWDGKEPVIGPYNIKQLFEEDF